MSANRVEYHQDAIADIKSAVAWYQKRSSKAALDFIEELNRATETIRGSPGTLAKRKKQYQALPAFALPFRYYLFRRRVHNYNLGCRSWQ